MDVHSTVVIDSNGSKQIIIFEGGKFKTPILILNEFEFGEIVENARNEIKNLKKAEKKVND